MKLALKHRNSKGQALVEIALITPLLLGLLYVVADFGIAYMMGNILATVARDGARVGSGVVKSTGTGIDFTATEAAKVRDAIQARVPAYLTAPRQIVVTFYEDDAGGACWESIQVEVRGTYSYAFYRLLALLNSSPPTNLTISRSTRMRYNFQQSLAGPMCTNAKLTQTFTL